MIVHNLSTSNICLFHYFVGVGGLNVHFHLRLLWLILVKISVFKLFAVCTYVKNTFYPSEVSVSTFWCYLLDRLTQFKHKRIQENASEINNPLYMPEMDESDIPESSDAQKVFTFFFIPLILTSFDDPFLSSSTHV